MRPPRRRGLVTGAAVPFTGKAREEWVYLGVLVVCPGPLSRVTVTWFVIIYDITDTYINNIVGTSKCRLIRPRRSHPLFLKERRLTSPSASASQQLSTDPPSLLIVAYLDISCAVHTVKTCRCSRRRCNFGHFPAAALHCIGVTALLQISLTRLTATKRHSRRSSGSTNWTRTFTMWVKLQPYDSAHPDIF